jgi:histidinol dehydrogenase
MLIQRLKADAPDFDAKFAALTARPDDRDPALVQQVADIISAVRERGDEVLVELTAQFDRRQVDAVEQLLLDRSVMEEALAALPAEQRLALETAADRIKSYHQHQVAESWEFADAHGNRLGQRVTPLKRVGLYVPGGKASYPSSVLMNAIPARVAGVEQVVMVVPAPGGELNPLVLAAAAVAGVDRVITAGGAQAVAALAYGTEHIPAVDKIVGPGNRYVAEAKRQVFGVVGIDMVAGPSEILILADGSVDPAWMAMDLFSQAEHDEQAQAILISPDGDYLDRVAAAIEAALPDMPRADIIRASLGQRGALIEVADMTEAVALSNRIGA